MVFRGSTRRDPVVGCSEGAFESVGRGFCEEKQGRRPPPNSPERPVRQMATRTCIGVRLAFTVTAQAWNGRLRLFDQVQGLSPRVQIRESAAHCNRSFSAPSLSLGRPQLSCNAIFPCITTLVLSTLFLGGLSEKKAHKDDGVARQGSRRP